MLAFKHWMKLKVRCSRGMTMLEVLFSFAILAVVSLTGVRLVTTSQMLTQDTQLKLIALGAARSVMEVVRTTPLADVSAISTSGYIPTDLPNATIAISTSPANLSAADIGTITIRVTWRGSQNRTRTLDITTVKTRYGRVE